MKLNAGAISFRRLEPHDFALLGRWLNEPHVHEWYDKEHENTPEDVAQRYGPLVTGEDPTAAFVVQYEDRPFGYIQTYMIADNPEYARHVDGGDDAAGVDLFIGEPDCIGTGLGTAVMTKFLREHVFALPGVARCIIGPEIKNRRAIRSYEKAGFRYWRTVQIPGEDEPEYLMVLERPPKSQPPDR